MRSNIVWSLIISIGIVIGSTLIGLGVNHYIDLDKIWLKDNSTPQYLFSSVSQSLAAIFALAFIVLNFITFFASKNLARHVYRYVFNLRRTWITFFLFILVILFNFIYLAYADDKNALIRYPHAFVANLILYLTCMGYLGWYAYTTYQAAISPFSYFLAEVRKGIPVSLKLLRSFLEERLSIDEYFNRKELMYWPEEACKDKQLVYHQGKEGYFYSIDSNSIRMALNPIKNNQFSEPRLYCLVSLGKKIYKNKAIFAFDNIDEDSNNRVKNILSGNAIKVEDHSPGWVQGFDYILPLFDIAIDQFKNTIQLDDIIDKLKELAEYYASARHQSIGIYDVSLKGFAYEEFLDVWFAGYYRIIKAACAVKKQMMDEGVIFERQDEPDFYISSALHRFIATLYKLDQGIFFNQGLLNIYKYSVFNVKAQGGNVEDDYLEHLKYVVMNISSVARKEINDPNALHKLKKYSDFVLIEYLNILKVLVEFNDQTDTIAKTYNILRRHIVVHIEDESRRDKISIPLDVLDEIDMHLLSGLFALSVFAFSMVPQYGNSIDNFIALQVIFFEKYIGVHVRKRTEATPYLKLERILDYSYNLISDKLHWFMNVIDTDDLYRDNYVPDSRIRTDEYYYYTYLLMLCRSRITTGLDESYWFPDNINSLRHYYSEFKKEALTDGSRVNKVLFAIKNQDKSMFDQAILKLDYLIEEKTTP